eukprot:gnl/MRDRNA2_/MRDRNA2_51936_c0_seq1.p2 gnl/MRDRNA2_/MRDRNA2_51936_c0~~gnl/MRDRNA2_/MRDRNA2_51936_c0_seq1.p2  ORF type:complete len:110 (+),score=13.61 gnl/MRDRNA2_/MRDRNA2_51936_c0_seq1:42-371(+)
MEHSMVHYMTCRYANSFVKKLNALDRRFLNDINQATEEIIAEVLKEAFQDLGSNRSLRRSSDDLGKASIKLSDRSLRRSSDDFGNASSKLSNVSRSQKYGLEFSRGVVS